jgi:Mn-dependent DtxR family transcriptional regulator
MPKKNVTHEEQMEDLLQKLLILELYKSGVKRDDITKILKISSVKVSAIIKHLNKPTRDRNE